VVKAIEARPTWIAVADPGVTPYSECIPLAHGLRGVCRTLGGTKLVRPASTGTEEPTPTSGLDTRTA